MSAGYRPDPQHTLRGTLQWLAQEISREIAGGTPTVNPRWLGEILETLKKREEGRTQDEIVVGSILSHRNSRGYVQLTVNDATAQLNLPDAMAIAHQLIESVEAAQVDQFLLSWAQEHIGVTLPQAAQLVQEFREFRESAAADLAARKILADMSEPIPPSPPTEEPPTP